MGDKDDDPRDDESTGSRGFRRVDREVVGGAVNVAEVAAAAAAAAADAAADRRLFDGMVYGTSSMMEMRSSGDGY